MQGINGTVLCSALLLCITCSEAPGDAPASSAQPSAPMASADPSPAGETTSGDTAPPASPPESSPPAPVGGAATGGATSEEPQTPPASNAGAGVEVEPAPDQSSGGAGGAGALPVAQSAGCEAAAPLPSGPATLDVAGDQREYKVYLPSNYGEIDQVWPLVLALHPNGQRNGIDYWDSRGVAEAADRRAVVVAGVSALDDQDRQEWRYEPNKERNLAYVDALLEHVKQNLCIDERRIFVLGFSGGGSFSTVLGCLRDDYRAIASGSGILYFELLDMQPEECVGKPAAWVNFGSEESTNQRVELRDFWRRRNECDLAEAGGPDRGGDPPCSEYGCEAGRVVHCSHTGGHIWPEFGSQHAIDFFLEHE